MSIAITVLICYILSTSKVIKIKLVLKLLSFLFAKFNKKVYAVQTQVDISDFYGKRQKYNFTSNQRKC